jgi:hypothetical protein
VTRQVAELTIEELELLIQTTVRRTIEDNIETLDAVTSKAYLESIREARQDYQHGAVTNFANLRDEC